MDVLSQGIRDQSPWCMLFTDDIVLWSMNRGVVESKLKQWRMVLKDRDLKISRKKTEYLSFNEDQDFEISTGETTLNRVEKFKYLGSTVADDGNLDVEMTQTAGWMEKLEKDVRCLVLLCQEEGLLLVKAPH
ncbi:uncharacterized protein [Macrobrachium rosenbergii]|uniref:uncharacterized protein n=1 Tax=Macrobrachium rosenbergii TaxID=79674 RepID=UPI0034D52EE6